jgi:hypothetical protein
VLTADAFVVNGWKAAAEKVDGFDDWKPESDDDARDVLCRVEACAHGAPYFVKAHLFPFRYPESAVAPLSGGRFAVVPLGATGSAWCRDGKGDITNSVSGTMSGDVVVLDEEVQSMAFVEEGHCEERGEPEHIHRVIDPQALRQVVVKTMEPIRITVSGRAVWIQGSGCDEMRNLDP